MTRPTERATEYIVRKVVNVSKQLHLLESDQQYLGRKLYQTANGASYTGIVNLAESDKKSLREFCRQATGHNHFHFINPLEYKFIGEAAIDYVNHIHNNL